MPVRLIPGNRLGNPSMPTWGRSPMNVDPGSVTSSGWLMNSRVKMAACESFPDPIKRTNRMQCLIHIAHPREVLVTGPIVVNAHLWHAGTANLTDKPRTALHGFYCRRDKPQQQYQKNLIDLDLQRSLGTPPAAGPG